MFHKFEIFQVEYLEVENMMAYLGGRREVKNVSEQYVLHSIFLKI